MRDVLIERVRPLVDRLAQDLTELAASRIEAELERLGEAFAVALSAYQSDEPRDLITAALGPELGAMLSPPPRKPSLAERRAAHGMKPRPAEERATTLTRNVEAPRARGPVDSPTTPRGDAVQTTKGTPRQRAVMRCRKCGPLTSAVAPKPDRRATIAELVKKGSAPERRAAVKTDEDVDNDDNPNAEERWSKARIESERGKAEANKHGGALPSEVTSFERDRYSGEFVELGPEVELDFGGGA